MTVRLSTLVVSVHLKVIMRVSKYTCNVSLQKKLKF